MAIKRVPHENTGSLIIISGPPGAGKSTVAKELVGQMPEPPAYIEGDEFWQFFPGGPAAIKQTGDFRTIMRSMLAAAIPYTLAGYETLLDFSIPPWYLKGILKIVHGRANTYYVILRPSVEICARRARERKQGPITKYDHEFYESFNDAPDHIISGDESPHDLAQQIYTGLQSRHFLLDQ